MNLVLSTPFTEVDILSSLKQTHPSKSPSPDGLPACFYKNYWPEIGSDVVQTVLDVLNNNRSAVHMNHTLLALILKTKAPTQIEQFRPISLCNVVYKLVSKALANRLKPILDSIISFTQSAFVPGRLITDNAILGFEVMHKIKNQKEKKKRILCI